MKKWFYIAGVATLVLFASCGRKQAKKIAPIPAEDSVFVTMNISVNVNIDSFLSVISKKLPPLFIVDVKTGKLTLAEKARKVKPNYLMPLSKASELQTLAQKNIALGVYTVDKAVAELYAMPTEEYDAIIAQLMVDVNVNIMPVDDNMDWKSPNVDEEFSKRAKALAESEKTKGNQHAVVERVAALLVEALYVYAQNPDLFTGNLTNAEVEELTYNLLMTSDMVNQMVAQFPEMQPLKNVLDLVTPLGEAISQKQLVVFLNDIKPAITEARNKILD